MTSESKLKSSWRGFRKATKTVLGIFVVLGFLLPFIAVTSEPVQAAPNPDWLEGWNYRMEITIDHTKVDSDLDNFPVLVYLDSTYTDFWSHCDSEANIAFTLSDGTTKLKREIELFDHTDDNFYAHVKVPNLSSTVDTDIYIYYDSASHGQTNDTDTWDDNFVMVQHMDDYTTSTIEDSTSYNNDGTKLAADEPIEADGKIGKAQDFDGVDDYVNFGSDPSLFPQQLTVELWFKAKTNGDTIQSIVRSDVRSGAYGYKIYRVGSDVTLQIGNAASGDTAGGTITEGEWAYVVGAADASTVSIYVNGQFAGSVDRTIGDIEYPAGAEFHIGRLDKTYFKFYGTVDEPRISDTARSAGWIKTTFNNQSDPASFYTVGGGEILLTPYPPEGPEQAAPRVVIRITSDSKATGAIENVVATLNINDAFSFLIDYPKNINMGSFSVNETKTAEWMLATPLAENTYSYNVTWDYNYTGGSNSITSDNANTEVVPIPASGGGIEIHSPNITGESAMALAIVFMVVAFAGGLAISRGKAIS